MEVKYRGKWGKEGQKRPHGQRLGNKSAVQPTRTLPIVGAFLYFTYSDPRKRTTLAMDVNRALLRQRMTFYSERHIADCPSLCRASSPSKCQHHRMITYETHLWMMDFSQIIPTARCRRQIGISFTIFSLLCPIYP